MLENKYFFKNYLLSRFTFEYTFCGGCEYIEHFFRALYISSIILFVLIFFKGRERWRRFLLCETDTGCWDMAEAFPTSEVLLFHQWYLFFPLYLSPNFTLFPLFLFFFIFSPSLRLLSFPIPVPRFCLCINVQYCVEHCVEMDKILWIFGSFSLLFYSALILSPRLELYVPKIVQFSRNLLFTNFEVMTAWGFSLNRALRFINFL